MTKKSLILSLVLFIFAFTNYHFSQNFNKSFFDVVYAPSNTNITDFLSKIRASQYYQDQLSYFSKLKPSISRDITKTNIEKMNKIYEYKEFLKTNPNSRDVLLKIAILDTELQNIKEARDYYKKAKQIDPEILIQELEG